MSKDERFGGIVENLDDNILSKYGITDDMVKSVSGVVKAITNSTSVQEVGDEVFVTINLEKIHFKFKKEK